MEAQIWGKVSQLPGEEKLDIQYFESQLNGSWHWTKLNFGLNNFSCYFNNALK